jgi:hypothetical protein
MLSARLWLFALAVSFVASQVLLAQAEPVKKDEKQPERTTVRMVVLKPDGKPAADVPVCLVTATEILMGLRARDL